MVSVDGNQVTGDEIIKLGKRIREVAQAPDGAVLLCCWTARAAAISCGLRRPARPKPARDKRRPLEYIFPCGSDAAGRLVDAAEA